MYRYVIAWRYLRSRRITYLSILGVAVGVAALLIVLAVMEGFQEDFQERIRGVLSDVIVRYRGERPPAEVLADIASVPHVAACAPRLKGMGLVIGPGGRGAVQIIGIDVEREVRASQLGEYILNSRLTSLAKEAAQAVERLVLSVSFQLDSLGRGGEVPGTLLEDYRRLSGELYRLSSGLAKETTARRMLRRLDRAQESVEEWLRGAADHPGLGPGLRDHFLDAAGRTGDYFDAEREKIRTVREKSLRQLEAFRSTGAFDVPFSDPAEGREVIIGEELMQSLQVRPGDTVRIYTSGGRDLPSLASAEDASRDEFTVAGTFRSRMYRFDSRLIYMPLATAQAFTAREGQVSEYGLRLDDFGRAEEVKEALRSRLPGVDAKTWAEKRKTLLAAIHLEKAFLSVVLFMIIVVAGFNMLATFLMMVTEKTRDLGILKALGGSTTGLASIFFLCGVLIAVLGSALGLAVGLLFVEHINEIEAFVEATTGVTPFPRDVYYLDAIPTIVKPMDVLWILLPTVGVSVLLGSVFPALKAALLRPDRALRYE